MTHDPDRWRAWAARAAELEGIERCDGGGRMRILRSSDEIRQQMQRLRNLKPVDGPHKRKVQIAIDEAIEELLVGCDDTTEEFEN